MIRDRVFDPSPTGKPRQVNLIEKESIMSSTALKVLYVAITIASGALAVNELAGRRWW